jgi:hypothetical protein
MLLRAAQAMSASARIFDSFDAKVTRHHRVGVATQESLSFFGIIQPSKNTDAFPGVYVD